jgi:hypothetical protein
MTNPFIHRLIDSERPEQQDRGYYLGLNPTTKTIKRADSTTEIPAGPALSVIMDQAMAAIKNEWVGMILLYLSGKDSDGDRSQNYNWALL